MPNLPHEEAMVRQALGQMYKLYGDYLGLNSFFTGMVTCPSSQLFNYVHFLEHDAFLKNLRLSYKAAEGCQVNGFTDVVGTLLAEKHSVVYLNRALATGGTVVHELLHAVSHRNWTLWSASTPGLNEAVTEYFTRKLIQKTNVALFQVDRTGVYDDILSALRQAKQTTKQMTAAVGGRGGRRGGAQTATAGAPPTTSLGKELRRAYFQGTLSSELVYALSLFSAG